MSFYLKCYFEVLDYLLAKELEAKNPHHLRNGYGRIEGKNE